MLPRVVRMGLKARSSQHRQQEISSRSCFMMLHRYRKTMQHGTQKRLSEPQRLPVLPLYTVEDVKKALPLFDVKPYDTIFHLGNGIKYRFLTPAISLVPEPLKFGFRTAGRKRKWYSPVILAKKAIPLSETHLRPLNQISSLWNQHMVTGSISH